MLAGRDTLPPGLRPPFADTAAASYSHYIIQTSGAENELGRKRARNKKRNGVEGCEDQNSVTSPALYSA